MMIDPRWVIPSGETCAAGPGNASIADAGLIRCRPRSIVADLCRRRGYGVTPARDSGEMAARCVPIRGSCRAVCDAPAMPRIFSVINPALSGALTH